MVRVRKESKNVKQRDHDPKFIHPSSTGNNGSGRRREGSSEASCRLFNCIAMMSMIVGISIIISIDVSSSSTTNSILRISHQQGNHVSSKPTQGIICNQQLTATKYSKYIISHDNNVSTTSISYNNNTNMNNTTRIYQLSTYSDITPSIATLAKRYVEYRYHHHTYYNPHCNSYRTTITLNPHGFCSNILFLAKGYAISVHTNRIPILDPKRNFAYNCISNLGIGCFLNTSNIFINLNSDDKYYYDVHVAKNVFSENCKQFDEFQANFEENPRKGNTIVNESSTTPSPMIIRDHLGFPLYYSNFSPECANVKFHPSLKAMGPELTFPPIIYDDVQQTDEERYYGFHIATPTGIALSMCIVWKLTDDVMLQVTKSMEGLKLTRPYAGLHVRRGDKKEGAKKPHVRNYLRHVPKNTATIFIASDSEVTIEEARVGVQELNLTNNIVVLPSFFGRNLTIAAANDMRKTPLEENYQKTVDLITEIEILSDADTFVGTGSSNVGTVTVALRACRGHQIHTSFSMDDPFNRQTGGTTKGGRSVFHPPKH